MTLHLGGQEFRSKSLSSAPVPSSTLLEALCLAGGIYAAQRNCPQNAAEAAGATSLQCPRSINLALGAASGRAQLAQLGGMLASAGLTHASPGRLAGADLDLARVAWPCFHGHHSSFFWKSTFPPVDGRTRRGQEEQVRPDSVALSYGAGQGRSCSLTASSRLGNTLCTIHAKCVTTKRREELGPKMQSVPQTKAPGACFPLCGNDCTAQCNHRARKGLWAPPMGSGGRNNHWACSCPFVLPEVPPTSFAILALELEVTSEILCSPHRFTLVGRARPPVPASCSPVLSSLSRSPPCSVAPTLS